MQYNFKAHLLPHDQIRKGPILTGEMYSPGFPTLGFVEHTVSRWIWTFLPWKKTFSNRGIGLVSLQWLIIQCILFDVCHLCVFCFLFFLKVCFFALSLSVSLFMFPFVCQGEIKRGGVQVFQRRSEGKSIVLKIATDPDAVIPISQCENCSKNEKKRMVFERNFFWIFEHDRTHRVKICYWAYTQSEDLSLIVHIEWRSVVDRTHRVKICCWLYTSSEDLWFDGNCFCKCIMPLPQTRSEFWWDLEGFVALSKKHFFVALELFTRSGRHVGRWRVRELAESHQGQGGMGLGWFRQEQHRQ